jgi:hypothetical protein
MRKMYQYLNISVIIPVSFMFTCLNLLWFCGHVENNLLCYLFCRKNNVKNICIILTLPDPMPAHPDCSKNHILFQRRPSVGPSPTYENVPIRYRILKQNNMDLMIDIL